MSLSTGYLSGCCAIQEIMYLSHQKTAKESMVAFCKSLWMRNQYDYGAGKYTATPALYRKVDAHYIFTGVVGYRGKKSDKVTYGEKFAAFITENGLGTVAQSGISPNRKNHPNHKVKAWIWTPAPVKLKQWYLKYQKEEKE